MGGMVKQMMMKLWLTCSCGERESDATASAAEHRGSLRRRLYPEALQPVLVLALRAD